MTVPVSTTGATPLQALLAPRSIAIVGASNDWRRFGGRPVHYLREAGYQGGLYPVNPGRGEVQGLKAWPSIGAIGQPVDCALLSITAEDTVQAIRDCAQAGVRSAVIFGAGFAEVGDEGAAAEAKVE